MLDDESKRVVEEVAGVLAKRVAELVGVDATVDALEDVVVELVRAVGRQTLEGTAQERVDRATATAKAEGYRVERAPTVRMTGVFGVIEVQSPYLRRHGQLGEGRRPAREVGVEARGRTRRVQRALVDFGAEESFAAAARRFAEHYGTEVERTAILRLVESHGERAERFVAERLQAAEDRLDAAEGKGPVGVAEVFVQMDGCELRTGRLERPDESEDLTPVRALPRARRITEWRDVRMGLVRPAGEVDPTYIGRLDKLPVVAKDLRGAACLRGLGHNTKVVACSDGGNGYREALSEQFEPLEYVLDHPHFVENLNDAAEEMGLKGDEKRSWVGRHVATVELGHVTEVIDELKDYEGPGEERVRRLAKYLDRYRNCVDYDAYRARGWPVGSGEIESSHRHIPQRRLKLPGAWWSATNLRRMLALRILRANGWWAEFWRTPVAA